jgi:regulator of cell morphogenesis and NO signaling
MITTPDTRVRDIVAHDFRAAAVFERFGIDFCCSGRRTVSEACLARNVNPLDVLIQVSAACERADGAAPRFLSWGPDALIAYIVGHHHAYVRRVLPAIVTHVRKVAASHGARYPYMADAAALFEQVAELMTAHLDKEEEVLFPYIEQLQIAVRLGEPVPPALSGWVEKSVGMIEEEHEEAGEAMRRIRQLTRGFTPPPGACTTFVVCLRELEEFERDLHVHVHLENNVLFPKVQTLTAEILAP